MSISGGGSPAWDDDLLGTSSWFDRLYDEAQAVFGPWLGIRYKRGEGRQVWRYRCAWNMGKLMSDSPIRRLAFGGGAYQYWPHWPRDLSSWLFQRMHQSTEELWTSEDGATLIVLAAGADRDDVRQVASQRLRQIKRQATSGP